jgi:hypothetical protein
MIDPVLVLIVASAAVASAIAVSVACVVTASRMGAALNVVLDIAEMMDLDRQRLSRIRKMRKIVSTLNGQRYPESQPPALYVPRHDQRRQQ